MSQNLVPLYIDKVSGDYIATEANVSGNNNNSGNPNQLSGYEHIQLTPLDTWVIPHNGNTKRLICQVYDQFDELILPDILQITDLDTIIISFGTIFAGSAKIVFF